MTIGELIQEFKVVIDSPEGLNELRSLILGLAVCGKLVPQYPNDEPASELLKKIEVEKNTFYEENNVRVPKIDPLREKDLKKNKPDQWVIVRLFDLYDFEYGKSLPKKERNERGEIPVFGSNGVIGNHDEYLIKTPAIVIGRKGSVGALNICREPFWPTDVTYYVCPYAGMSIEFSYYHLQSLELEELGKGIKPGLTRNEAYELVTLLPPLAEQHRIVQKIESLFAEVDELEAKLNRQTNLDEKLQLAVNSEVQQAPDADTSKSTWHFITSNFDTLYHTPEAIDNLKKNILNEAVLGRLVPQNPDDEPTSELLKKIETEKERLYEEGEVRKPNKLPPLKKKGVPFEIPESWEWCRFGDYAIDFNTGLQRSRKEQEPDFRYPYLKMNNISNDGELILDDIVNVDADEQEIEDNILHDGDFLFNTRNSVELVGKTCVVRDLQGVYLYNNNILRVKFYGLILPEFVNYWFISSLCKSLLNQITSATTNVAAIYQKDLLKLLTPLPPLEEQHRIVQRIEELFAICNRFKAQLEQREKVNERLVKGLVQEVLEGASSLEKESVQEKEILIAAEPEAEYSKQQLAFFQILCIAHALYVLKKRNMLQGEMGLAKYVYLMDRIGGIKTHFKFDQNNFGPYPSNFRKRLFTRSKYFYKSGLKGFEVIDLTSKSDRLFEKETEQSEQISHAMESLTDVFKPYKNNRAHKLELMASVCWLVEITGQVDFDTIWEELEGWETPKRDDVDKKSELFTPKEVMDSLNYIIENSWDKKLKSYKFAP